MEKLNTATTIHAGVKAGLLIDKLAICRYNSIWNPSQVARQMNEILTIQAELNVLIDSMISEYYGENAPVSDIAAAKQAQFNKEMP